MGYKRNYRIFTLDAKELMKLCSRRGRRFDLNSPYDRERILINETKFAECALFYQIVRVARMRGDKRSRKEILSKNLVYLYFEGGVAEYEKETTKLLSDGFELRFKGDKTYTQFCVFDKSASMSRNNTISFINEELFDTVDEALDVGIDKSKVKLIPSKYYAYRGLYMTDGIAVEPDRMELNEKTVIVLKTAPTHLTEQCAIGINNETNEDGKINVDKSRIKELDSFNVMPYDGEGLVSPAYAEIINREISHKSGVKPTSFQIRMPFTKGMLHSVEYMAFMKDWFSSDQPESLEVTDVFGISRKLKDAQIILTDSMFKCGKWLEKMLGTYEIDSVTGKKKRTGFVQDPMKYYFDNFHKYDHALYIANTDAGIRSNDQVKMNYQFFNTLGIARADFEELVEKHLDDTEKLLEDPYKGRQALLAGDENEISSVDEASMHEMQPWEYALKMNAAFVLDPMIRKRLRQAAKGRINDVFKGRIVVDGTVKYLSGDLLSFLIYIAEKCNVGEDGKATIEDLKRLTLKADRFYISGMSNYGMTQTKYYGVFRSPHLSRNEQCALRPFASKLYNRYFSQLKGIVMVSNFSNAPAAMSGADFDGDMVKIITNDVINNAILDSVYKLESEDKADKLGVIPYKRIVPIPVISSPAGGACYLGKHISYRDLNASFASRVGIISNLAIKMGKLEYAVTPNAPLNSTALCTIATGLEIDSVKNGVNPDISKLQNICKETEDVYLDISARRKKVDGNKKKSSKVVHTTYDEENDEYKAFLRYENEKKPIEDIFSIKGGQTHIIDLLPYYYAKALNEGRAAGRIRMNSETEIPDHMFTFEQFGKKWREETLNDPRIPELIGIIGAYRRLVADAWNISRAEAQLSDGTLRGRVITLLDAEYEKDIDILLRSGEFIEEAMESAYQEIYDNVKTPAAVDEILELMEGINWQYTMSFEEKSMLLKDLFGTDKISMAAQEIICDRYDNGYQILNYVLRDIKKLRELEALQNAEGPEVIAEDADEDDEAVIHNTQRKVYNKELFTELFEEYRKYYTRSDYSKTDWLDDAGERCREEVLKLFTYEDEKGNCFTDADLAIQCTVALDKKIDEKHSFLWGVFHTEDFAGVIYNTKKGAANA